MLGLVVRRYPALALARRYRAAVTGWARSGVWSGYGRGRGYGLDVPSRAESGSGSGRPACSSSVARRGSAGE